MIPFTRAVDARTHKRVVMVVSSQSGKTEAVFDILGRRLHLAPVPIIYLGPSKVMLETQLEPRIKDLLESTVLAGHLAQRQRKLLKTVNGVPLRLAHGGSSSALKSDPAGLVITDEADELMANVKGAGSPIELIDLRGDTYADFVHAIISTPSEGAAEVHRDEESGLEFWRPAEPDQVSSTIWRLWQSGTMFHWSWPCPHCEEYFIPRFNLLKWDKPTNEAGKELPSDPALARRTAHLSCPNCGTDIVDDAEGQTKAWMNQRGTYVAPGQHVLKNGSVVGDPPDTWTISFWASGLASPFVSWGERAARYVNAARNQDSETVKVIINGGMGELYAPGGGQVPEWQEVASCSADYPMKHVVDDIRVLVGAVDVQQDRLIYVVRGFGAGGTSWLVECGELYGDTSKDEVWDDLADFALGDFDGMPVKLWFVDSGFRPGKKFDVPSHRVYEFCRRFSTRTRATKGSSSPMRKPIMTSKIDVMINGKQFKSGLELIRLDTDHWKSWVHERVRWSHDKPGAWFLPADISEDYCMQIVSEARMRLPSGKVKWFARSKENHFLDCEAMLAAAASSMNLFKLKSTHQRLVSRVPSGAVEHGEAVPPSKPKQSDRKRRDGWLGQKSIWS